VGTAHVPKVLNLNPHIIQFDDKIEGITQITIDNELNKDQDMIDLDNATFLMKTYGNDHIYTHNLKYMKYIKPDTATIIPIPENNKNYDYILKVVPLDKYDCNATYYVRFKIIKITKPNVPDYLSEKDMDYNALQIINKLQLQPIMKERVKLINQNNNTIGKVQNTLKNNKEVAELVKKYKNIQDEKKIKQTLEQELEERCNVIDGKYYLSQMGKRNAFGVRQLTKIQITPMTTMYNITGISEEIIEKLKIKMLQLERIDINTMKSILSFANKELPKLKIIEDLIPLTARLLRDTMESEVKLHSMMQSKLVTMINEVKDNKLKMIYQSENLLCKIYRFLRNVFTFTEEKDFNLNVKSLDF